MIPNADQLDDTFTREELSTIKLLVLMYLERYNGIPNSEHGAMYQKIKQLATKVDYIQRDTYTR